MDKRVRDEIRKSEFWVNRKMASPLVVCACFILSMIPIAHAELDPYQTLQDAQVEVFDNESFDLFLSHYYQDPQPELVPQAIQFFMESSRFEDEYFRMIMANFFGEIIFNAPSLVEYYKTKLDMVPYLEKVFLLQTLFATGELETQSFVVEYINHSEEPISKREVVSGFIEDPIDLDEYIQRAASSLDIYWAKFFASGDSRYVEGIIDALGERNNQIELFILYAAQWSLQNNGRDHDLVKQIIVEEYQSREGFIHTQLGLILDELKSQSSSAGTAYRA